MPPPTGQTVDDAIVIDDGGDGQTVESAIILSDDEDLQPIVPRANRRIQAPMTPQTIDTPDAENMMTPNNATPQASMTLYRIVGNQAYPATLVLKGYHIPRTVSQFLASSQVRRDRRFLREFFEIRAPTPYQVFSRIPHPDCSRILDWLNTVSALFGDRQRFERGSPKAQIMNLLDELSKLGSDFNPPHSPI